MSSFLKSYCFDQCGVFLGTLALAMSGLMTSYSCKLLFKTAEAKNSRNLEFLAFKLYGYWGKLLIEIWLVFRLSLKIKLYLFFFLFFNEKYNFTAVWKSCYISADN